MSVHSPVTMSEHHPWDDMSELPTKFNKYRRHLEKHRQVSSDSTNQVEARNGQSCYNGVVPHSSTSTTSSVKYNDTSRSPSCVAWAALSPSRRSHVTANTGLPLVGGAAAYRTTVKDEDELEMPLNLTMSATRDLTVDTDSPRGREASLSSDTSESRLVMDVDDSFYVDEHFQRSLGSIYTTMQTGHSPPPCLSVHNKSSTSRAHSDRLTPETLSVTNSVDEHFSKSLGDLWTKVKSTSGGEEAEPSPSSVDAHFAKALGDTWFQLSNGSTGREPSNGVRLVPQTSPSARSLQSSNSPRLMQDSFASWNR